MKDFLSILLSLAISITAFSNDGVYLSRGGVIYPTIESKISLEKEILNFTVRDKICQVDILFEFNNPETVERKLMVGFQAPMSLGDVNEDIESLNQIKDFIIMANGQILPYQFKMANCEDCELMDPKKYKFEETENGIAVYLFEVNFKPGINKINHSYRFPASFSVAHDQFYNYILKTGSKWEGGKIKNLTVNIDLGPNKYFYVSDSFGKDAAWSVVGSGKITQEHFDSYGSDTSRMVRVLSGHLHIEVKNFYPRQNIEFGIVSSNTFFLDAPFQITNKLVYALRYHTFDVGDFEQGPLTKEELKILRNTIYAQYGYDFKNKELKGYFSQFEWYIPDPNLKMEDIILSPDEKVFIQEILKRERE